MNEEIADFIDDLVVKVVGVRMEHWIFGLETTTGGKEESSWNFLDVIRKILTGSHWQHANTHILFPIDKFGNSLDVASFGFSVTEGWSIIERFKFNFKTLTLKDSNC